MVASEGNTVGKHAVGKIAQRRPKLELPLFNFGPNRGQEVPAGDVREASAHVGLSTPSRPLEVVTGKIGSRRSCSVFSSN